MEHDDPRTKNKTLNETGTSAGIHALNIVNIVQGLVQDLNDLRAGKLTIQKANAHSKLAHEILRGINFVISAQKFIEGQAIQLPSAEPSKKNKRSRKAVVDLESS